MTNKKKQEASQSKRIGGVDRAKKARAALTAIFKDEKDPRYYAKDMDFAVKYDVSRHTIKKIREAMGIPARSERILLRLKKMNLKEFTIKELSALLHVKYQNLYKLLTENSLEVKSDVRPVESLKRFQQERKKERMEQEQATQ